MTGTAYVVAEAGKAADYVFIVDGKTTASSDDLIYIAGEEGKTVIDDSDLGYYYLYNAVVDGKVTEIMVATNAEGSENKITEGKLYSSYSVDEDSIYSDLTPAEEDDYKATSVNHDFKKASNEVITVGGAAMAYTDDVALYVIEDGDITVGSINRSYSDNTIIYYTVNSDGAVTALYIVK